MRNDSVHHSFSTDGEPRRVWVAPSYSKVKAGDAEGPGPNPDSPDSMLTKS